MRSPNRTLAMSTGSEVVRLSRPVRSMVHQGLMVGAVLSGSQPSSCRVSDPSLLAIQVAVGLSRWTTPNQLPTHDARPCWVVTLSGVIVWSPMDESLT